MNSIFVLGALLTVVSTWANVGLPSPLASQSPAPSNPEITIGEPGTSFRYVETYGTSEEPYLADTAHINRPLGLFVDNSDNLYVTEEQGHRVLKYRSTRENLLALGQAGICESGDIGFCNAKDVAVDGDGNLWVVEPHRVVQYSQDGTFQQEFPADEPWSSGSGNDRFDDPNGIAFDTSGRMYVSDYANQRIQIFDMITGSPVYSATIGYTDVISSTPGYFDHPMKIALDSSDRLYVAEIGNNRVQRCTYSSGWSCTVLDSNLNGPQGIAVDNSDNVYIADTWNGQIRKCTSAGACSNFVTDVKGYTDVAVDSVGNVYGAAPWESVIDKFNPSGVYQGVYLGVEFVPYLTDNNHYFHPRVAIDPSNNVLIIEENGHRLVKLDPNGNFLWSFGVPGVDADDNSHLAYPHGVATDGSGNVYVAGGCQIKIISAAGSYLNTLGTGCGTGDYEFGWASGIDVDASGNIYVADYDNHRVQIYNSDRVFIGRIGVTGECSAANDHLCTPIAVEVDASGNIYVTDGGNLRVQKFNSSRVWQMTIGDGTWGERITQLSWPEDVAVDAHGRIYVSDWNNNRVQVFDPDGAYLTTIAGSWGFNASQLKGAPGVDVNSTGDVYVADWENHRIQKFALGVPKWKQVNINGFGKHSTNGVNSLEIFNGQLYASASNWDLGAQLWRSDDGMNWVSVSEMGFGSVYTNTNPAIPDMIEFGGHLYASTAWDGIPGQIWRSPDGTTWTQVVEDGFGNSNNNAITRFIVFNNTLYAATGNSDDGAEIWRSTTGNPGSWVNVVAGGSGDVNNIYINSFATFGGYLYAAGENPTDGAEVWRTSNGTTWTQANTNGFGDADNIHIGSIIVFNNMLYASTRNDANGAEIWRSSNGTSWTQFANGGIDDPDNSKIESLYVFDSTLYAVANNNIDGVKVWRLDQGDTFIQINVAGFGDSNNDSTLWNGATIAYQDQFYIGTSNWANGGELWRYEPLENIYLPLVVR